MASKIVPGGCDTWERVFEFEKPPRQRYPSDLTYPAWQHLRHLLIRRHPKGGRPCPEWRWREYVDAILCINRTRCT
jgi:hypothetical protein